MCLILKGWRDGQLSGSLCNKIHEQCEERCAFGLQWITAIELVNNRWNLNGGST
jgi:hypothetical protein